MVVILPMLAAGGGVEIDCGGAVTVGFFTVLILRYTVFVGETILKKICHYLIAGSLLILSAMER